MVVLANMFGVFGEVDGFFVGSECKIMDWIGLLVCKERLGVVYVLYRMEEMEVFTRRPSTASYASTMWILISQRLPVYLLGPRLSLAYGAH